MSELSNDEGRITMKVDVLQVSGAKIGRFSWWSNWVDVSVFNYGGYGHLLQMKVSRSNKKKFRTSGFCSSYKRPHATINEAGDLI